MIENKNLKPAIEKVALVGLALPGQSKQSVKDYLDELAFLVRTAGGEPVARFVQNRQKPHPKTFVGRGKLDEIRAFIENQQVDTVVFDDELTPSQQFQLEKELGVKVLDRTRLILDIFAMRARTAYARTQVELAQYEYLLPRLKGMWTHLERQRGGIGMRGPGEREIETDRRIVKKRIADLRRKLAKIDTQKQVQRSNRGKMVRVALVGYTNVGKSTLMNLLTKSNVLAEDKLFATLDTKTAKIQVGNISFLLSDTVGFIRKLPTQLVESFKSTLDEVREADILLHVADAAHPALPEHIATVRQILQEIGAGDKPEILVMNKVDLLDEEDRYRLANSLRDQEVPVVYMSARTKEGLDDLKRTLYRYVRQVHVSRFPYDDFLYPDLDFLT